MREVIFPTLDEEAPDAQGVLATWFVDDGERVQEGELLAELQVSKISGEIAAPAPGTLRHKVAEGAVARQGCVIAVIE